MARPRNGVVHVQVAATAVSIIAAVVVLGNVRGRTAWVRGIVRVAS